MDRNFQRKKEELAAILYNKDWKIEQFLEVFPRPVDFFENKARTSNISENVCMNYLREYFPSLYFSDIEAALSKNKNNLTITALKLKSWKGARRHPPRPKAKYRIYVPRRDITNYRIETAYIENRRKILAHISEKERRKREEYEGDLYTCCCCFEDDLFPEDVSKCMDGHYFCKTCIKRGADLVIGSGKGRYNCFNGECKAEFSLAVLEKILDGKVLKRLTQNNQIEEINAAGIEGLETCPSCPYAAIPDPESKLFICLNPDCSRVTCRKCKHENHFPLGCEEVETTQTKMRTYIENKMTEAMVRTCWKCKKTFIKSGGCNKMTCTCGAMMCYLCQQPVENYSHFSKYEETGNNGKCPLFTDDRKVNFNAIKSLAIKAKREVMKQNPNLKLVHDPTLLLRKK